MELALCGPLELAPLREWLDGGEPLPSGLGGTPVADLARAALGAGWRVQVFTLTPEITVGQVWQGPRLTLHAGPFRPRHRAIDGFQAERAWLRAAIGRARPALVHAHWTYEFALGAIESGVPAVVTAHDAPLRVLQLDPTPYRAVRTWMAWRTARRARHLTAVSDAVAEHFHRYFRYRRSIAVIPNGVPGDWFAAAESGGPGAGFASILNGWGRLKNGRTLLEAFALVRRALPQARLALYGTGHGPGEEAETWAARHGLAEQVHFRGAVARPVLREALRTQTQIVVHPSLEESFGMTIAEAMAMGIPVIAGSGSGAVAGTLGGNGVLTDVRSAAAMAGAMLRLAHNRREREELAARAKAAARRKFAMENVLAAYAEIYREAQCGSCIF